MFVALVRGVRDADPDVGAWEIADALFLAERIRLEQSAAPPSPREHRKRAESTGSASRRTPAGGSRPSPDAQRDHAIGSAQARTETSALPSVDAGLYADVTSVTGQRARRVRTPAGRALSDPLGVMRALRPLMRRTPSRTDFVLDVDATVAHAAEAQMAHVRVWSPVMRPRQERWLTIDLVCDASPSMRPWRGMVEDLRELLTRSGGFRGVRFWRWDPGGTAGLTRDGAGRRPTLPAVPEARLVLVVTDCLDDAWRDSRTTRQLAIWAQDNPVAIVQTLPEHLWSRTALADWPLALARQPTSSPSNRQLQWSPLRSERDLLFDLLEELGDERPAPNTDQAQQRSAAVAVPLITLEAARLRPWARMIAGRAAPAIRSVLVTPDDTSSLELSTVDPASWIEATPDVRPPDEDPEQRAQRLVEGFRGYASSGGRRLATCLTAIAPVTLSIMRVVRDAMVASPSEAHIAEVLLSGFFEEIPGEGFDPAYVWTRGVHERLSRGLTASHFAAVTGAVTRWMDARIGSPREMSALTPDPSGAEHMLITAETRPFAFLYAENLRRLGLAAEADRLAARADAHATVRGTKGLDLQRTLTGHDGVIFRMAWSPDGRWLLTPSVDGTIRFWEAATGRLANMLRVSDEGVNEIAWLNGGASFAAACHDGYLRTWDFDANGHLRMSGSVGPHQTDLQSAAGSPDGSRVAVACKAGGVRVYAAQGEFQYELGGHGTAETPIVVWRDDQGLVAGTSDGWAHEYRGLAVTGPKMTEWHSQPAVQAGDGQTAPILSLASSRRGMIACGDDHGDVFVWYESVRNDPHRVTRRSGARAHDDTVTALAFSPDGLVLASKGMDGRVRFWRTETWELVGELSEPNGNFVLTGLAWHPTLPLLATLGDHDRSVRVWHVDMERLLPVPAALSQTPNVVRATARNRKLSYLGTQPYWELAFDDEGHVIDMRSGRVVAVPDAAVRLERALDDAGITDLFVIVHGWNSDRADARRFYNDFFIAFSDVLPLSPLARSRRPGALGVFWPSKAFAGDDVTTDVAENEPVDDEQPEDGEVSLGVFGGLLGAVKNFARPLTYFAMRKRARNVGTAGLGPFLRELHRPERLHLIGHSIGARLPMYALRAMGASAGPPVASVALLQPAMGHLSFSERAADPSKNPPLAGTARRVAGPLVVTYWRDDRVKVAYEMSSRLVPDDDVPGISVSENQMMGVVGADGVSAETIELGDAGTPYAFRAGRVVNVDVGRVITSHADVARPEIAWLVVSAAFPAGGNGTNARTAPRSS